MQCRDFYYRLFQVFFFQSYKHLMDPTIKYRISIKPKELSRILVKYMVFSPLSNGKSNWDDLTELNVKPWHHGNSKSKREDWLPPDFFLRLIPVDLKIPNQQVCSLISIFKMLTSTNSKPVPFNSSNRVDYFGNRYFNKRVVGALNKLLDPKKSSDRIVSWKHDSDCWQTLSNRDINQMWYRAIMKNTQCIAKEASQETALRLP